MVGDATKIRAMVVRKTKTDRRDALHLLELLRHDRLPTCADVFQVYFSSGSIPISVMEANNVGNVGIPGSVTITSSLFDADVRADVAAKVGTTSARSPGHPSNGGEGP